MSEPKVKALTREELDKFLEADGAESVIVHGFCHPASEQLVFYMGGLIAIRCRTCNRHVVNIAVTQQAHEEIQARLMMSPPADEAVRLKPSCHMKNGLYLTYSDGTVLAVCGKCKAKITDIAVRPSPAMPEATNLHKE